jgi:hypothetical protein
MVVSRMLGQLGDLDGPLLLLFWAVLIGVFFAVVLVSLTIYKAYLRWRRVRRGEPHASDIIRPDRPA